MKTLAQFKAEQSINKIELLQGKGRKFCSVRGLSLIVGEKTDLAKPLYIVEMTIPVDESQPNGDRVAVPNCYLIINATNVKAVEVI